MSRFEQEALPHMRALQSFALQLCKDEQYSQDLVQETMFRACAYFHTYREGTNCRAWLFRICKNTFINEVRRRLHQPVPVDFQGEGSGDWSQGSDDAVRGPSMSPRGHNAGNSATDAFSDEVFRALAGLQSEYRTVVILRDIEGHTYDEIGEYTRRPLGTVRSRLHRGRKQLARQLSRYARAQGFVHSDRSHLERRHV